jgi:DNA uptake protein ComE-like DNA-binding protein
MTRRSIVGLALLAGLLAAPRAEAQVGKGLLDPNSASEQQLTGLPNVTPAIAKAIVDQRPFARQAEFDAFLTKQGLSDEQRKELYGKAFLHLNLNDATPAEILMIPNIGQRMVREFEEYRPYKALAQWRREIGKYFPNNPQEVARMEQYVFVPINLNTASDEDILTIPGIGQRMLREFKEYRPYKSMDQWRREIGKYFPNNPKEVQRMERYVTIEQ